MARWTSGQSRHPFTVESVSSNLTRVIYARVFRRGSGADCKSVGLGFEWFDSILSHLIFLWLIRLVDYGTCLSRKHKVGSNPT